MEFPLIGRELSVSARKRSTYVLRMLPAVVAFPVILMFWMAAQTHDPGAGETLATILAVLTVYFHQFVVFMYAPLVSAPLIAREKEQNTLPLLLLADQSAARIYAAKFLAAFIQAQLLLLSTLPLLAILGFLGGVSVPDMFRYAGALLAAATASVAIGLFASIVAHNAGQAFGLAATLVVFWVGAASVVDVVYGANASPLTLPLSRAVFEDASASWLLRVIIAAGITVVCAIASLILLPRQMYRTASAARQPPRPIRARRWRRKRPVADQMLLSNRRGLAASVPHWTLKSLIIIVFLPVAFVPVIGGALYVLLVLFDVIASTTAARREGDFEDMLLAPLTDKEVSNAVFHAQLRRNSIYFPVMIAPTFYFPLVSYDWVEFDKWTAAAMAYPFEAGLGGLLLLLLLAVLGWLNYRLVVATGCAMTCLSGGPVVQSLRGLFLYWLLKMAVLFGTGIAPLAVAALDSDRFGITADNFITLAAVAVIIGSICAALLWAAGTAVVHGFRHELVWTLRYGYQPSYWSYYEQRYTPGERVHGV